MDQQSPIYLDHNATSRVAPQVVEAMADAMRTLHANPASQHEPGRQVRRVVEDARERIVQLLGGETTGRTPDRLVFTSGGTEANNLALFGLTATAGSAQPAATGAVSPQVVISAIEHPSVVEAAAELTRRGFQTHTLSVTPNGVVDPAELKSLLSPQTRLVSVMLGNNETGALQPIAPLAEVCSARGIPLHTDAVQAVGKIDVQFRQLGAAALSFTAHKFHGPLGIGGLLLRGDLLLGEKPLQAQLFGGFQQAGLRPGTESAPLVVGLRTALELWHAERAQRESRLQTLRDRLQRQILAGYPDAVVVAGDSPRLPHTLNIALVGLDRQALVMALDMAGVACSTGSACASGSSEPSPVLLAMGCDEGVVSSSLRLSVGVETTPAEVDEAARRILLVCKQLQQSISS